MRFSCVTVCVYPTETAVLMPCSPSQVIHTRFTLLAGSQCSVGVQISPLVSSASVDISDWGMGLGFRLGVDLGFVIVGMNWGFRLCFEILL